MNERLQLTTQTLVAHAQRFWQWWSQELLGLIPERWLERLRRRGNRLFLSLDEGQCHLSLDNFSQAATLASAALGPAGELPPVLGELLRNSRTAKAARLIVLLPSQQVLRKVLSLPAATEAGLHNVLRFEMDRHTPFTGEQVYFGYRILERDRRHQRLHVELLVVPRDYLDELLKSLDGLGVHPSVVSVAEGEARWTNQSINLLPGRLLRTRNAGWRGSRRLQVTAVLGLLLLAGLPLLRQQQRLEQLTASLDAPKANAARAATIREQLQAQEASRAYLLEQQAQAGEALWILNELTGLLPDSTWLSRFELSNARLRLDGESAEASGLIALLEQAKTLQNVSYASPITSNPRTQKDRFSLFAERRSAQEAP
jgi:general secretion pathway protein L